MSVSRDTSASSQNWENVKLARQGAHGKEGILWGMGLLSHVASPTSKFTIPKDMSNLSCVFRDLWKMLCSSVPISSGSLKAQKRFKGEKEVKRRQKWVSWWLDFSFLSVLGNWHGLIRPTSGGCASSKHRSLDTEGKCDRFTFTQKLTTFHLHNKYYRSGQRSGVEHFSEVVKTKRSTILL